MWFGRLLWRHAAAEVCITRRGDGEETVHVLMMLMLLMLGIRIHVYIDMPPLAPLSSDSHVYVVSVYRTYSLLSIHTLAGLISSHWLPLATIIWNWCNGCHGSMATGRVMSTGNVCS